MLTRFLTTAALMLWSAISIAQPVPRESVISFEEVLADHFDEISSIQTCGHWENAGQRGFYRIIMLKELFGASRLFVQWMASATPGESTRSVYTESLWHFNDRDDPGFTFGVPECRDRITGQGVSLLLTGIAIDTRQSYRFDVRLGSRPGRHVINSWVE